MASAQDNANRKNGNDESQISFNQNMAEAQRDKTTFRANSVARTADPFASGRLNIQEDRY